jgi:dienelactone hydrolase
VARAPAPAPKPPFSVAELTLRLVDRRRGRTLITYVRYPRSPGRFPLIVFGHGFTQTPAPYSALLQYWARAGYVVAAPVFPFENANAPGGPNENDLVNQPADVSFVISRLLGRRDVNRSEVAVAGHSDGGETALAVAYDVHFRDRRVRAAVILSGAKIPGVGGFEFPAGSPPLLASQGTADPINPPSFTFQFYDAARAPKYLLTLLGASHLPPYTGEQPQDGIVERVSTAFLDLYLKREQGAARRMRRDGDVPGLAQLSAAP